MVRRVVNKNEAGQIWMPPKPDDEAKDVVFGLDWTLSSLSSRAYHAREISAEPSRPKTGEMDVIWWSCTLHDMIVEDLNHDLEWRFGRPMISAKGLKDVDYVRRGMESCRLLLSIIGQSQ